MAQAPSRPTALPVMPANIPLLLREKAQWVVWRYKWLPDKKKWDKPPLRADNLRSASSTDDTTWASFGNAWKAYQRGDADLDGIGFVVREEDGLVGIDLDKCRDPETGDLQAWAQRIMEQLQTYTEVSPSGTGLRLWVKATRPSKTGHKTDKIEVYCWGRYLTLTGNHFAEAPKTIEARQAELETLERTMDVSKAGKILEFPQQTTTESYPDGTFRVNLDADFPSRKLKSFLELNDQFKRTWQRKRKDFEDQSASVYDLALANAGVRFRLTDQEIVDLCVTWRLEHDEMDAKKCQREDYWTRLIAKARASAEVQQHDLEMEQKLDQFLADEATGQTPTIDSPYTKREKWDWLRERYGVPFDRLICEMSNEGSVGKYIAILIDGRRITYGPIENLLSQRKFLSITIDAIGSEMHSLKKVSEKTWEKRAHLLISLREILYVSPENEGHAMILEWLTEYLDTHRKRIHCVTDPLMRSQIVRTGQHEGLFVEDGYVWFRLRSFREWLEYRTGDKSLRPHVNGWLKGIDVHWERVNYQPEDESSQNGSETLASDAVRHSTKSYWKVECSKVHVYGTIVSNGKV
jgi:hypothetical protein